MRENPLECNHDSTDSILGSGFEQKWQKKQAEKITSMVHPGVSQAKLFEGPIPFNGDHGNQKRPPSRHVRPATVTEGFSRALRLNQRLLNLPVGSDPLADWA
jgi:hypothetical protein